MKNHKLTARSAPATAMQVGLLVENVLADVRGINFLRIVGEIDEPFERASFTSAWNHVVSEFDVLRMSLQRSTRATVDAHFHPVVDFQCRFIDLSEKSANDAKELFRQRVERREISDVEVTVAPAMRVECFQFTSSHWRFLWVFHHSLLEGYSVFLIINRLFEVYEALCRGETPIQKPQPEFRSFLEWSAQQDHRHGVAYFRDLLAGFDSPTPLPFSRRNQQSGNLLSGLTTARLNVAETFEFESAAKRLEVTPNTIVQFCWALLLSRYSGEADVVFGTVWSLRGPEYSESKQIAGLLINTTPVRVQIVEGDTVRGAIRRLRTQHRRTKSFRHTPLTSVWGESGLRRDQPLFQSLVVFDYQRFNDRLDSLGNAWANR